MVSKEQEQKIVEETKLLVEKFLETKLSDIELSKITGISSSTIGRRLNNKPRIMAAFPENGEEIYDKVTSLRNENLENGKIRGSQMTLLNHTEVETVKKCPKLLLEVFFYNPERQKQFLFHLALTSRAKPELLAELFQMSYEEVYDILKRVGDVTSYGALRYYMEIDDYDQEKAKTYILKLYRDVLNANKNNDKAEKKRLLEEVTDAKASQFKKKWAEFLNGKIEIKRKDKKWITDEEIGILINYQLKYALTDFEVAETFEINRPSYRLRVGQYVEDKPDLKARREQLIDRNNYDNRILYGFGRK